MSASPDSSDTDPTDLPYGLAVGDVLRWQKKAGGSWRELRLRGLNTDGSLNLYDPHYGYCRAIKLGERPENFEVKRRGPRGGVLWLPIVK